MRRLGARLVRLWRSRPEPTLAGRITLTFMVLAFFGALALGNNQVFFVTCTVLATILLSGLLTYLSPGRLGVERVLPDRVFAGAAFDVHLKVRNLSRWRPALGLAFRDALQGADQGGATRGPVLPVLPPGRTVEITYAKRMHRRGVYTFKYTLAATRFPFGIFERHLLVECPLRLVVLPALGRLHRAAQRDLARQVALPRAVRVAREGNEEFHSLREYRPGDNPRHIHWRTSARAGTLVRRVMRQEASQDLVVLLDTCVEGFDGEQRARCLEKAVSCAATLLAEAARRSRRAAVHFAGGSASHSGSRGGLLPALAALAGLEAGRTNVRAVLERLDPARVQAALLVSLQGPAQDARRAAKERGLHLTVWDASHDSFARYFGRR